MEFLILPVKETALADMQKIYVGLRTIGNEEYASYIWRKIQVVEVDKSNPYVEIQGVE